LSSVHSAQKRKTVDISVNTNVEINNVDDHVDSDGGSAVAWPGYCTKCHRSETHVCNCTKTITETDVDNRVATNPDELSPSWCAQAAAVNPKPFDLLIRNARVATASDCFMADIGIQGGRITMLGEKLAGAAR
jgi:hypothetical protein